MWGVEGFWGWGGLSGQCQTALTVGVLSCIRPDMFTVCSVFYELSPPFFFSSLSSLEASLFSDVMEEANESLRNGMIYSY